MENNIVFQFLEVLREEWMQEFRESDMLSRYIWIDSITNSRKDFVNAFLSNSIFDTDVACIKSGIVDYSAKSYAMGYNPVKTFASAVFGEISELKRKMTCDPYFKSDARIKRYRDLIQVLDILKCHFTCHPMKDYSRETCSMFDINTWWNNKTLSNNNPEEWQYLPKAVISFKLHYAGVFPVELNLVNFYEKNHRKKNFTSFINELAKGMPPVAISVFTEKAMQEFLTQSKLQYLYSITRELGGSKKDIQFGIYNVLERVGDIDTHRVDQKMYFMWVGGVYLLTAFSSISTTYEYSAYKEYEKGYYLGRLFIGDKELFFGRVMPEVADPMPMEVFE